MSEDFEQWLMSYHAEQNPEILDDGLADAFSDWVIDLDPDDWFRLGDKFANSRKRKEENGKDNKIF